jgi:serine/threonine protein kinase/tetratricopeptide (TPR) repeat protein
MPQPPEPEPLGATAAYQPAGAAPSTREASTVDRVPAPKPAEADAAEVGRTLAGRYTLLRACGKGGMGRVWLARDEVLGREVALKELLAERADLEALRRRLLHEAQITGQLQHPGIVPIYDVVGDPAGGRLFYTMRFVEGRTLAEAVRDFHKRRGQGNADRLGLLALLNAFATVCDTIAYAHSRGVLHRDLKGENVILGDFGEILVLDWGLAKTTVAASGPLAGSFGDKLTSGPLVATTGEREQTVAGQVLGTPAYMPPEQAAGDLDRVNERSDVYGLGALLYLVLTGRAPFAGKDVAAVLRQVREQEPPRPRQVWPGLPAALEAVCLRTLAKDPGRRYPAAREVGAEVRRWLADEPVSAHREPLRQRLGRWGRRHRALVSGAAALLVAALVALVAGVVLLGREKDRTAHEADNARRAADDARSKQKEAEDQRDRAKATLGIGLAAIDEAFTRVSENILLDRPGMQPERKQFLESALRHYQKFLDRWGEEPAVRAEVARAWYRAGRISAEIVTLQEAVRLYDRAFAIQEALLQEQPGNASYQAALAETCGWRAASHRRLRQYPRAIADARRAVALQQELVDSKPPRVTDSAEFARVRHAFATTLDLVTLINLETGNRKGAETALQVGVRTLNGLIAQYPEAHEYKHTLVHLCGSGGLLYRTRKEYTRAVALYRASLAIVEALPEAERRRLSVRQFQGNNSNGLGLVLELSGQREAAEDSYRKAAAIRGRLAEENPTVTTYRGEWGTSLTNLGGVLARQGKHAEALACLRQACGPLEGILASAAADEGTRDTLGDVYRMTARVQREMGDLAGAIEALGKERKLWPTRGDRLYAIACELAGCAAAVGTAGKPLTPAQQAERRTCQDLAVETLRQAVQNRFEDAGRLRKDAALRPLHDHADFQKLLGELEGKNDSR